MSGFFLLPSPLRVKSKDNRTGMSISFCDFVSQATDRRRRAVDCVGNSAFWIVSLFCVVGIRNRDSGQ